MTILSASESTDKPEAVHPSPLAYAMAKRALESRPHLFGISRGDLFHQTGVDPVVALADFLSPELDALLEPIDLGETALNVRDLG